MRVALEEVHQTKYSGRTKITTHHTDVCARSCVLLLEGGGPSTGRSLGCDNVLRVRIFLWRSRLDGHPSPLAMDCRVASSAWMAMASVYAGVEDVTARLADPHTRAHLGSRQADQNPHTLLCCVAGVGVRVGQTHLARL